MKKNEKNLNTIIVIICLILFSLFIYNYFFIVREGNENKKDTNKEEKKKIKKELDNLFEDIITKEEGEISIKELLSDKSKIKNIKSYIKKTYEMSGLEPIYENVYNKILNFKLNYKSAKDIHDSTARSDVMFFILDKIKKDYDLDLNNTNSNSNKKVKKRGWW
jgi:hypothetical protein